MLKNDSFFIKLVFGKKTTKSKKPKKMRHHV